VADWLLTGSPPASIVYEPDDARGLPGSGSVLVSGLIAGEAAALSQCVAGNAGAWLGFGGAARIDGASAEGPMAFVLVEAFSSGDCSGAPIADVTSTPLAGDSGGFWRPLPGGCFEVPGSSGSVLISFVVREGPTSVSGVAFDDLYLVPSIFADGFESGDASRWSGVLP
jgi:hypothetical protein